MSASLLFVGLIVSSIGLGFFLYGRKQRASVPMLCGLALMIYPYFVTQLWVLILIGLVLAGIPYFIRY
ncbi:hypothetical protein [Leeia oryzae]|uniref:hypothetical protein n=1 Tax=Leeia oryzae TaxID=356662 RepID=UPI0003715C18|nr:hypothetical protein [Leeia oryzae]